MGSNNNNSPKTANLLGIFLKSSLAPNPPITKRGGTAKSRYLAVKVLSSADSSTIGTKAQIKIQRPILWRLEKRKNIPATIHIIIGQVIKLGAQSNISFICGIKGSNGLPTNSVGEKV